tara:strand:- start:330 stop:560 length:231 start_codon:yes stop_codon:yes gene_type:complete
VGIDNPLVVGALLIANAEERYFFVPLRFFTCLSESFNEPLDSGASCSRTGGGAGGGGTGAGAGGGALEPPIHMLLS